MPLSGNGVSALPNGDVAGAVSQPNTYGSPSRVVRRKRRDARSRKSVEWIDTYGYSHMHTRRLCALIPAIAAYGSG